MDNSLFFCNVEKSGNQGKNETIINMVSDYSNAKSVQAYVINAPLNMDIENRYAFDGALIVLIPKNKICLINMTQDNEGFEDFCEDLVDDIGYLSEKYDYRNQLGRPRIWRESLIAKIQLNELNDNIDSLLSQSELSDMSAQRSAEFIISLLIGSINDIDRIGGDTPLTVLDQIKKSIILFDGDQSRFIYSQLSTKKRITIQGLAGTGKTELLLHKLKDLYTRNKVCKIAFTCYNNILAQSMSKRVPDFFNFMKVEEQIKWKERLWVMPSWGSARDSNSGMVSFICSHYQIQFHPYSQQWPLDAVCQEAISKLRTLEDFEPCFDYVLIDESQDFPQSFFDLCELVTKHNIYIVGDIFQDIYDRRLDRSVKSDYLLNKCYRTDPRTLMFAHAVGMGLYEKPVIRWLEDSEWEACGYHIQRENNVFTLSRAPLRRFENIDTTRINNIEVIGSKIDPRILANNIFDIIDNIRSIHSTVKAEDIAIVFLEGKNKINYQLADYLAIMIPQKYKWKAVKGYEIKDSTTDAVFISNRNNIKGLEFPFVICIASGSITDNVFLRNTIYMILTRSFISSYFLVNDINQEFIEKYKKAAETITQTGVMALREPPEDEKKQQNQKISIAAVQNKLSIKDIVDDVFKEYPDLTSKHKKRIGESMVDLINDEGGMTETEIIERTKKMISAYM